MKQLTLAERHTIDKLLGDAEELETAPALAEIGPWMRLMRRRLCMTQRQLALRSGVPQSSISRIECGQVEPALSTAIKLYTTLFCELVFLPVPQVAVDRIIERQARKAAEKKVKYLQGTMKLEEQGTEDDFTEALVREEQDKLIRRRSSTIWD